MRYAWVGYVSGFLAFCVGVISSELVLNRHGLTTLVLALIAGALGYLASRPVMTALRARRARRPIKLGDRPTRDRWLYALADELRPELAQRAGLEVGLVAITADPVAWRNQAHQGICNLHQHGRRVATIHVNPDLTEPLALAELVAHELLHAGLPWAGHNWTFREAAERIGLRMVTESGITEATPAFEAWAAQIVRRLGPYPAPVSGEGGRRGAPVRPVSLPVGTGNVVAGLVLIAALLSRRQVGQEFDGIVLLAALPIALAMRCGLTDSWFSPEPRLRVGLQLLLLFGPALYALLVSLPTMRDFAATHTTPNPPFGYGDTPEVGFFTELTYGLADASHDPVYPHVLPIMVLWLAYLNLAPFLALYLWFTRPVVRYYRQGSFTAPTPPFARARWDRRALNFLSRSNPRSVGLWLAMVELAARGERARRGLPVTVPMGGSLPAELIPASGFVIERHGPRVEVAAGTAGEIIAEADAIWNELHFSQGQPGRRRHRLVRLMHPKIITVRDDTAPAPVAARRGTAFAYPEG